MPQLNKTQLQTAMNLFAASFVNSTDETMRQSLFIQYSDAFGHEIDNWQKLCREKIKSYTSNPVVLEHYDMLVGRIDKHIDDEDIIIRKFEADDIDEVREILNEAFRLLMLIPDPEDDKKIQAYDIYRHWGFEESESLFMQHYF